MAHFSPPLNRYRETTASESVFENPITRTRPTGWKGKSVSKREYASATDNEDFWKEFSGDRREATGDGSQSLGVGIGGGENRLEKSDTPNDNVAGTAAGTTEVNRDEVGVGSTASQSPFDFPHPDVRELQLRARIQAAIERMPEEKKGTLRLCEEARRNRWKRRQQELRSSNTPKPTWQRTFGRFTFPVEFPVGQSIDEANNEAVNLRLYTECLKKYIGEHRASEEEPLVIPLPPDIKALMDLLNRSLPSSVELGYSRDLEEEEAGLTETTHLTEEIARLTEETARLTEETARLTEETARLTEKVARLTEETACLTGETARLTWKTARLTGKTARLTWETTHLTEEIARLTEETACLTGETARLTEETACLTEETARLTEIARLTEETACLTGETARLTGETARLTETTHLTEEIARLTEGAARLAEEAARLK